MSFKKMPINKDGRISSMKVADMRVGDEVVIYTKLSQNTDNPKEIVVLVQGINKDTDEIQVRVEQGFSIYVKCFDVLRVHQRGNNW